MDIVKALRMKGSITTLDCLQAAEIESLRAANAELSQSLVEHANQGA